MTTRLMYIYMYLEQILPIDSSQQSFYDACATRVINNGEWAFIPFDPLPY